MQFGGFYLCSHKCFIAYLIFQEGDALQEEDFLQKLFLYQQDPSLYINLHINNDFLIKDEE